MENEVWVPVYGNESRYEVSNLGRIKSLPVRGHHSKEIVLRQASTKDGYLAVTLTIGRGLPAKNTRVHRIVLSSFLKRKLEEGKIVNHIDGDKKNNRVENLEEITVSENAYHAYSLGLRSAAGERNGQAKLTSEQVLKVREMLLAGDRVSKIYREVGIHQTTVSHIKSGKMWGSVTGWDSNYNFYTIMGRP